MSIFRISNIIITAISIIIHIFVTISLSSFNLLLGGIFIILSALFIPLAIGIIFSSVFKYPSKGNKVLVIVYSVFFALLGLFYVLPLIVLVLAIVDICIKESPPTVYEV